MRTASHDFKTKTRKFCHTLPNVQNEKNNPDVRRNPKWQIIEGHWR